MNKSQKSRIDKPLPFWKEIELSHFRFIFLINAAIFIFYQIYRLYMILYLLLVEHQNFFSWKSFYGKDATPYNFPRVLSPLFLYLGFAYLIFRLCGKHRRKVIDRIQLLLFEKKKLLKKYLLFLLISFAIVMLIPGFSLLIRNLNTQYGFFDADSYASLVTLMYKNSFNVSYFDEGGLQFGKYYIVTMPTLILTYFLGLGNLILSYNLVITLLVFLMILNITLAFRTLFPIGKGNLFSGMVPALFAGSIIILVTRMIIFCDQFNYDPLLQLYTSGFYGSIGGAFLLSSAICLTSYLVKRDEIDQPQKYLILFTLITFGSMIAQSYFNLLLIFVPASGILLSLLFSEKDAPEETIEGYLLCFGFFVVNCLSYLALDIFPGFNVDPKQKFFLLFLLLTFSYGIFWILNSYRNNCITKLFLNFRSFLVPAFFFLPLFVYFLIARGMYDNGSLFTIVSWGYPLKAKISDINNSRLVYISLLISALFIASLMAIAGKNWLKINKSLRLKLPKYQFFLAGVMFVSSLMASRIIDLRKSLPLEYPPSFSNQMKIMNLDNQYVFDQNGIRVTYNQYLVDVVKYFVRNQVQDMAFWIVSKTPSLGEYEHGLLTRIIKSDKRNIFGLTVTDVDSFAKNIFDFEATTRGYERGGFKNRYLIIDNNFSPQVIGKMEESPIFKKVYQNKLYKIYKMGDLGQLN